MLLLVAVIVVVVVVVIVSTTTTTTTTITITIDKGMDTIRREIIALLRENEMDARAISRALGIREKEVYAHLPHIARTLGWRGEKLFMTPPQCLSCGYVFTDRARVTRPGRCPRCRGTRVSAPVYRVA